MGNVHSDVTSNVKAQADAQDSETYKLIDVKGGGELMKLMKDPVLRRNTAKLDEEIYKRVIDCLYNEGRGEDIPIQQIVFNRSSNKFKNCLPSSIINLDKILGKRIGSITKRCCWDINKRGAVGETPLHLCFLAGSTLHKDLAKRLVRLFPELVNDIYLMDEFYGENALHMAIVNEDPNMVKYLLQFNIDMYQRACGNFFLPDDQKCGQQESLMKEYPLLQLKTNYSGRSYYGEYPLSFAAVMGQFDCVRLLLTQGVDPNKQDSNGNTVLHMLVIHNKLEMFKFVLLNGARLELKNRLNYTPLALATKLARKEIFTFIMDKMRTVYWVYADVSCAAYPLTSIDTISETGKTNPKSILYSIVNSETVEHLQLLDGLIIVLLREKWKTFIKARFFKDLLFFVIFFLFTSAALILKRMYFNYLRKQHFLIIQRKENNSTNFVNRTTNMTYEYACLNMTNSATYLIKECKCALLYPKDPHRVIRSTVEFIVIILAIMTLVLQVKELLIEKYKLYLKVLIGNPTKFLYLASCFLIILIIPIRIACADSVEDILSVLALIFMTLHFLYYCRAIRIVGPFVLMIMKMIKGDLFRFFLIYSVFIMGFSQALYVAGGYSNSGSQNEFHSVLQSMISMFVISLGEFADLYSKLDYLEYTAISKLLCLIFMIIAGILLINTLIAMMGNTYAKVNETKNEWLRQWAKVLLALEQSVNPKDRLKYQKRYTHLLNTGERALVVRWKQSESERADLLAGKEIFREGIREINDFKIPRGNMTTQL